jgi:hypothetical protein
VSATPEQHNEGDTRSIYTSWTTSQATATMWATASRNGGVVMTANIPESRQPFQIPAENRRFAGLTPILGFLSFLAGLQD